MTNTTKSLDITTLHRVTGGNGNISFDNVKAGVEGDPASLLAFIKAMQAAGVGPK